MAAGGAIYDTAADFAVRRGLNSCLPTEEERDEKENGIKSSHGDFVTSVKSDRKKAGTSQELHRFHSTNLNFRDKLAPKRRY